jgi:hypothetical protein
VVVPCKGRIKACKAISYRRVMLQCSLFFRVYRQQLPPSVSSWKSLTTIRMVNEAVLLRIMVNNGRCWTADRLARRRLPCPAACPLCDQAPETLQHLLLGCVVAQEIWVWTLNLWDRLPWLPPADAKILQWWTSRPCPKATQRDLWTSIILLFWCIWRHRNDVVFNGARPDVEAIKTRVREEYSSWRRARLFRSESFGFEEPVPWIGGE